MRDVVRDYLRFAAGAATGVVVVVEEARKRAEDELRGLVPEPVQEAVAGVVGAVRSEADKVWGRLGDGVVQVGVVLEFLEQQVRHLQGGGTPVESVTLDEDLAEDEDGVWDADAPAPVRTSPSARAEEAFPPPPARTGTRVPGAPRPVRVVVDEDPELAAAAERRRAAVPGMKKAAERRAAAGAAAAPAPAEQPTAQRTPAKKTAAKKTAAKKTAPAKKTAAAAETPAVKAAAKEAAVKKAPARKVAAQKATVTKVADKPVAEKPVAAKKTAAKRAPAKKAQPKQTGASDA